MSDIPVITFDGPGGVGKGTVSKLVAKKLGWHYLDSGALYRVLGLCALQSGIDIDDEISLAQLAESMQVEFLFDDALELTVLLDKVNVSAKIRTSACSDLASKVSAFLPVRKALVKAQRDFLKKPGLVADGRDMGTVIFSDAKLKFFLDADAKIRAHRRLSQLKNMGVSDNIDRVLQEIEERDKRDRTRRVSPLLAAVDAITIDTGLLSIDEVFALVDEKLIKAGLI